MTKNWKRALRAWRKKHHPAATEMESLAECARRSGVSTRTWQRWESETPSMNHGTLRVLPVPMWLRHRVEEGKPLPEPRR